MPVRAMHTKVGRKRARTTGTAVDAGAGADLVDGKTPAKVPCLIMEIGPRDVRDHIMGDRSNLNTKGQWERSLQRWARRSL